MTSLRPRSSFAACVLCLPVLVASSSAPPASQPETFSVTRQGDRVVVDIGPGTKVLDLLNACQPFLDEPLYYRPGDQRGTRAPVDRFEVSEARLWQRLQPVLVASDLAWIPDEIGRVFVFSVRKVQRGDITARAHFIPLEDLTAASNPWSMLTALIATTVVPLDELHARSTFTSLRQYFRNVNTESITPIDDANALVITAAIPALLHMVRVIEALEEAARARPWEMRTYELKNADAAAVAAGLEHFLGLGEERSPYRKQQVVLPVPDRPAVLVHAARPVHALIADLLKELDQP